MKRRASLIRIGKLTDDSHRNMELEGKHMIRGSQSFHLQTAVKITMRSYKGSHFLLGLKRHKPSQNTKNKLKKKFF